MGDNHEKCKGIDVKKVIIEEQYIILSNLTDELTKLTSNYRLLVGAADELNKIALATKSDVRKAIKRATNLGKIIDQISCVLEKVNCVYLAYAELQTRTIPLDKLMDTMATQQQAQMEKLLQTVQTQQLIEVSEEVQGR